MKETTMPDHLLPVATLAYQRGKTDRLRGLPFDANPFGNPVNHRSWNVGWREEDRVLMKETETMKS